MSGGAIYGGAFSPNGGEYARTGTNFLWLGGDYDEIDSAYQTITIPGIATNATLSFYYNILSYEGTSEAYDTFAATIQNTSGSNLATIGFWSNVNQDPYPGSNYYHLQTFDLLPFAGQTVRVNFASTNDASMITDFFVDDVSATAILGPPTNDACAAAIGISAGTTYILNTTTANSGGDPTPGCQGSFGKGVWYTFTPLTSGTVTISSCGSDFDTVLAIYTGSCGSLSPVACNDDNGPVCSGSQASVSFAGTAGTTYFILAGGAGAATGNLAVLATVSGTGLTINPTFDSTITSDPQAAAIETTINAVIALYQSSFSNTTTVTIDFQEIGGGVATSSSYYMPFTYSAYRSALAAHSTTADDASALARLPNWTGNPVNGDPGINLNLPLARSLGFSADPPPGEMDAAIYLNTSAMNISVTASDPTKYSLFSAVCHEIDEVLGMRSALDGLANGDPSPAGALEPEDLFRYDQFGARSLSTDTNTVSYFSLDGITDLARFNQLQNGDFHDWYSGNVPHTPQVQDAFGTKGSSPVPGVELRVLDAIGYSRIIAPVPALALKRSSANIVVSWPASSVGFTLQSTANLGPTATWAAVTNLPVILTNRYNVTNFSAPGSCFYRLAR